MTRQIIATDRAPAAVGPYSQAIKTNDYIFTAGQLGLNPFTGKLVEGVEAQTRQALANIEAILFAAGSSLDQVVKTTIFLADMNDFSRVNAVYSQALGEILPARSTVQVAALPLGGLVEIEAIALCAS